MVEQKHFWRSDNPIVWGLMLSFIVVALFGFLALRQGANEVSGLHEFLNSPPNAMGDTLAGFAGTLAFIWIVVTVWLQSSELAEQREQISLQTSEFEKTNDMLAAQRFDQAFFGLLSAYNEIISGIEISGNGPTIKGRDCFIRFNDNLRFYYHGQAAQRCAKSVDQIRADYDRFWKLNQTKLGHYFRLLYNAFRFISENPLYAKPHHARLLRSQLSDQELQLLFYNCLSEHGEKFLEYAKQFALFDNLPRELLFHPSNADLMPIEAWGSNVNVERAP
jgi:hypothetical protein